MTMGREVQTTDEPEAAHLRGVLRRIDGILDRAREQGGWRLSPEAALGELSTVVAEALRRPRTNGAVIDELYAKIAQLEGETIERRVDLQLLHTARSENAQLRQIQQALQAEVTSLRREVGAAHAAQASAIDLAAEARAFLVKLGEQIVFLAEHEVPIKLEIAESWSARLRAIGGQP